MPSVSNLAGKDRFVTLDALRGIAALCVVFHHAEQFYGHPGLFAHAYLAVDFFFMLSGFVINGVYLARFGHELSPARFMILRVKRLWPTLAIGVGLGATLAVFQHHQPMGVLVDTVAGLSFIPILSGTLGLFLLDGVEWSLFFELIANYVHCIGLWRFSNPTLAALIAISFVILLVLSFGDGGIGFGDRGTTFATGFARVALPYATGIGLQRLWSSARFRLRVPALLPLLALPISFGAATLAGSTINWLVEPLIVALLFPLIIWLGAGATLSPRLISLGSVGGALSYPLYAIHLPLIGFGDALARMTTPLMGLILRLAALSTCLIGAWILARFIDKAAIFKRV